jgi:Xaa-Pro aminopeptidase
MDNSIPFKIPAFEIDRRTGTIQSKLQQNELDGLLVIQRVDLLYFSGTAQNAFLYVPASGDALLMVKKYFPRAVAESSIGEIIEIKSVREIPERIMDYYGALPKAVGFEMDVLPVNDFHFYSGFFPGARFVDGSRLILETRMIKSPWEIEQMRATAALSHRTFDYMKQVITPGLSEMEFAAMVEAFSRKYGHAGRVRVRDFQTEGYPWHVLSGENSALLGLLDSPASGAGTSVAFPIGAGWKKLNPDEPVMVDFATILNGYHMDETRMLAVGSMPDEALGLCKASIEIHNGVLEKVKPGMTAHEVYEHSMELARKLGCEETYLGPPGYKVSFVGHGIGMELIEPPILAKGKDTVLVPGMTFALEPKLVKKDAFMVGIESVFEVTESGIRMISTVPAEAFIC